MSRIKGDRSQGYDHPSFSSTLLDSIYRSIDDSSHDLRPSSRSRSQSLSRRDDEKQNSSRYGGNSMSAAIMMKSSSASLDRRSRVAESVEQKSRDRLVDKWMQKSSTIDEDLVIRRRSLPPETTAEFSGLRTSVMTNDRRRSLGSVKVHSSPVSSSDSSSAGRFSSYDADFFSANKKKKSLKPIRTSVSDLRSETFRTSLSEESKNPRVDSRPPKSDSAGKSAKSRAMKLYGDLKRMKQPISPGGKLASFLNSLFSASGGSKKQRISSSPSSTSNFTTNTTPSCSTASSYSRSCLSKRPSSAGRYDSGVKRSVRFCPVSIIVDEDLQPCGHKSLRGFENLKATTTSVEDKNKRVEEMARDLLRNYHQKRELDLNNNGVEEMVVDDDCDDVESCCSSDLFELEIGVDRFCEELPVYETTRVDKNRAIANGLMV